MRRSVTRPITSLAMVAVACSPASRGQLSEIPVGDEVSHSRAGIAVVASGGIAGWQHVTLLDSASARYVTVTRRTCGTACAPLDSASGTLAAGDVARIYAIAATERASRQNEKAVVCESCNDPAVVTTAVFGNRRRTVIRSGREASAEVLGRVNVALAEAIRAARTPLPADGPSAEPND